jgi:hypothetical protein
MNTPDRLRYEMLLRVRDFGAAHASSFPADSLGGQTFAAIEEAVADLAGHTTTRVSAGGAARHALRAKAVAQASLRGQLRAVRDTARALALDAPGLRSRFVVPRSNGAQALIAAGRASVQHAQPLGAAFVAHGLPATFLDDLDKAIGVFEAAIGDYRAAMAVEVAARTGFEATRRAAVTAAQRLDAIAQNRLRGDPAACALWQRARRVERRAGRAADSALRASSSLAEAKRRREARPLPMLEG